MIQKTFRTLILLAISGVVVSSTWSQAQKTNAAQTPAPGTTQKAKPAQKQNAQPNAEQIAAPDTGTDVVQLSPKDLPQDPLRVGINNAIQKGMQEAKPNPAATLTLHTVAGNSAHIAVPNAAATGASNVAPNTAPNLAKGGSAITNPSSNVQPSAKRQPNPKQPEAAPTGPIPPAINAGIAALVSSKASLENSGNKWGGHKDKAVKLIDQALTACGQTPAADSGGTNPSPADGAAAMQTALTQLTAAQKNFTNAKNAWGGRRDQALAFINQALTEVQASIDFAKK
jgi:hypothetical protein